MVMIGQDKIKLDWTWQEKNKTSQDSMFCDGTRQEIMDKDITGQGRAFYDRTWQKRAETEQDIGHDAADQDWLLYVG